MLNYWILVSIFVELNNLRKGGKLVEGIKIYSSNLNFDGIITIDSSSKISAVKGNRDKVSAWLLKLSKPGVYMLFINDSVYVGQSSSSIGNRIFNVHSNGIEKDWQSVIAFTCDVDSNSLLFLENALCEYAHRHYNCLTSTPSRENCNESFRYSHYHLSIAQLEICSAFFRDIRDYLAIFSRFSPQKKVKTFTFESKARDSSGTAEIEIHCGKKRKVVLKRGSKISKDVSLNFASSQNVTLKRNKLISEGKIVERILQVDVNFSSQSAAGEFLNGTSFDGNSNWKTDDGTRLKELL